MSWIEPGFGFPYSIAGLTQSSVIIGHWGTGPLTTITGPTNPNFLGLEAAFAPGGSASGGFVDQAEIDQATWPGHPGTPPATPPGTVVSPPVAPIPVVNPPQPPGTVIGPIATATGIAAQATNPAPPSYADLQVPVSATPINQAPPVPLTFWQKVVAYVESILP